MNTKDFLTNHIFIKWVNHPDRELNAYWKDWMAANPEQLPQLKLARELLLRVRYQEIEARPGAKGRILDNILNSPPAPAMPVEEAKARPRPLVDVWGSAGQFVRVAAILLVIITLSWLASSSGKTASTPILAEERAVIQKSTAPGEKLQLTLSDGTKVWLNAVSELEFPADFGTEERLVTLSGEAFFDVAKDPNRPFKVLAKGTVTTALGTAFNVNTKTAGNINISLVTGRVKVEAPWVVEGVFLDPGQELHYSLEDERLAINRFDAKQVIGWKEGRLVFAESNLPDAVKRLEEWYGVTVALDNAEEVKWKYSGEYQNQTLDNVLNSMAYIQKFKYTIEGNKVEFKF